MESRIRKAVSCSVPHDQIGRAFEILHPYFEVLIRHSTKDLFLFTVERLNFIRAPATPNDSFLTGFIQCQPNRYEEIMNEIVTKARMANIPFRYRDFVVDERVFKLRLPPLVNDTPATATQELLSDDDDDDDDDNMMEIDTDGEETNRMVVPRDDSSMVASPSSYPGFFRVPSLPIRANNYSHLNTTNNISVRRQDFRSDVDLFDDTDPEGSISGVPLPKTPPAAMPPKSILKKTPEPEARNNTDNTCQAGVSGQKNVGYKEGTKRKSVCIRARDSVHEMSEYGESEGGGRDMWEEMEETQRTTDKTTCDTVSDSDITLDLEEGGEEIRGNEKERNPLPPNSVCSHSNDVREEWNMEGITQRLPESEDDERMGENERREKMQTVREEEPPEDPQMEKGNKTIKSLVPYDDADDVYEGDVEDEQTIKRVESHRDPTYADTLFAEVRSIPALSNLDDSFDSFVTTPHASPPRPLVVDESNIVEFLAAEFADVQDSTNSVRNPEEPENIEPSTDVSAHFTAPPTDCATTSSASITHSDRSRESSVLTLVMDEESSEFVPEELFDGIVPIEEIEKRGLMVERIEKTMCEVCKETVFYSTNGDNESPLGVRVHVVEKHTEPRRGTKRRSLWGPEELLTLALECFPEKKMRNVVEKELEVEAFMIPYHGRSKSGSRIP